MSNGHNTKVGSNKHFNHVDFIKVNVSSSLSLVTSDAKVGPHNIGRLHNF